MIKGIFSSSRHVFALHLSISNQLLELMQIQDLFTRAKNLKKENFEWINMNIFDQSCSNFPLIMPTEKRIPFSSYH